MAPSGNSSGAELTDDLPRIPVLFASDLNYLQHTAACIASLVENNPGYHFDVVLTTTDDFTGVAAKFYRSFEGNANISLRIENFKVPSSLYFPLPNHLTLETYIRFWIADLFKDYGRALYLDPDIIVLGGIAEIWDTKLQGRAIAAVPIPGSVKPAYHGMPAGSLYFNAGVMLFDLDVWRARGYRDVCLEFLRKNPGKATDGDQDILNICLMNDWVPLPFKWNVISPFYYAWYDMGLAPAEIDEVRRDARIIHFNGASKPWSYFSVHPRRAEYWKYLRMTEWRDARPLDDTWPNRARKWAARMIPAPVKQAIRSLAR
jgi:lipopolysaccharide biosynthesis glycosyltransferase